MMDVSTSWTGRLPGFMRAQLQDPSKKESFDKEMGWTERLSKSTRATLHFRGDPYGVVGDSRFDLYQEVLRYRLGDEVANITTPLLITDRGRAVLAGPVPGAVRPAAAEGANRHCEPMGLAVRDARIFGWLARYRGG